MTTSTIANVFLAFSITTTPAINYSLENETGRQWPLNPKDKEIRPIYARFVQLLLLLLMPINTACTLMERWKASLSSSSSPTFCCCYCLCTHLFTNNLMRLFSSLLFLLACCPLLPFFTGYSHYKFSSSVICSSNAFSGHFWCVIHIGC